MSSSSPDLQQVSIATTTVLTIVTSYFLATVGLRIRFWLRYTRKKPSRAENNTSKTEAGIEPAQPDGNIQEKSERKITHPFMMFHVLCLALLVLLFQRAFVYIITPAIKAKASQTACNLLYQYVHLTNGLGIVFTYTFVWRIQRYFYYSAPLKRFYTKTVRCWSWSTAVYMVFVCMIRLMLLMAGWRFGIQYQTSEEYGCTTQAYSKNTNVTRVEWNFMYIYNTSNGGVMFLLVISLYINLCVRMKTISSEGNNMNTASEISALGFHLLRSSFCAIISLASAIVSQVLLWKSAAGVMPAVLFNNIDDAAIFLQVLCMICSMVDWKEAFIPTTQRCSDDPDTDDDVVCTVAESAV